MSRGRLNVFIERDHAQRLEALAATKGISKSGIVAAAIAAFLSPEDHGRQEAALARRIDKLSQRSERVIRDQTILIETVSLFIRLYLSVSMPIDEAHQDAARAQGKARFEQFITQLGIHLQRGGSLVKTLQAEVHPDESVFTNIPTATGANGPSP